MNPERNTLQVKATSTRRLVGDAALAWSQGLKVEVGGAGTLATAGVVLPWLLADRLGLTAGLAQVVARAGFFPLRHRGRALVDAACALAAGATCLADVEAMTAREELFGPGGGASGSTMLRALEEPAERLGGDGLPGRRLARVTAAARVRAWEAIVARHGQLPAVRVAGQDLARPATEPGGSPRPVLVIRLDATLIEAASPQAQAAGTYKGGFGFPPLTGWCSNIGDAPAVMQRPGNAGSFTAADHLAVLKATFAQVPAGWRTDVLVSIDGAGASHEVIEYLTALNTAPEHGRRGRPVEYSIGRPVDDRTMTGIEQLRNRDWSAALHANGDPDPAARVAELTGLLRRGPGGDRPATWPPDMRVLARRTPRPLGKPAKLGEHPDWEYGAFATNTAHGQIQFLDARHRTQAHVEDRMKQFKACGARNLPSIDYGRNAAWLQLAALATTLTAWLRHCAHDGELTSASTKTLRFRILSAPARLIIHARRRILKIPPGWAWASDLATAWDRLQALHPA
ncbi:MAG: transposase [Pseudonocardiales bacterium]|nr:transposase [Pseudonocardiales bacterium]MBW0008657.1 transposase [Pseudonocardiales bacterium]